MSIELFKLSPQKQFAAVKLLIRGEKPLFKDKKIIFPRNISARYICNECGKFVIPTFHLVDIKNGISTVIRCYNCGKKMVLYLMGTELQQEVKKIRNKIREDVQSKLSEFF